MNVWNFVSGYVKICIMGRYPEGLVNKAVLEGIPVWNVTVSEGGNVVCTLSTQGLKRLRRIARGSGCHIRILSKHGLACALRTLRYEPLMIALAVIAIIAITSVSRRLWFIRLDCGGMDKACISSALEVAGVRRGALLRDISLADVSSVLSRLPYVAKADVERHGVVLSISITEGGSPFSEQNIGSSADASAVYAAKDCVITDIIVLSGKALVGAGDSVKAGQMIISGDLGELKEGYSVPAVGEAYGKVLYRATAKVDRIFSVPQRTGEYSNVIIAELFGASYMLGVPFKDYELEPQRLAVIDACILPIKFKRCVCWQIQYAETLTDEQSAKNKAEEEALLKLYSVVPHNARILSVETEYLLNEDGTVTAEASAVVIERISY